MNDPLSIPGRVATAALTLLATTGGAAAQLVNVGSNGVEVEASDLSRRLVEGNTRGAADGDVMVRTLEQMDAVRQRLHRKFDAGEATQQAQRGVLNLLDEAIALALRQRREGGGVPSASGDQRQMPPGGAKQQPPTAPAAADGQDGGRRGKVSDEADAAAGGALDETQRMWGHLPPREREAIVQSMGESVLDQYRVLIEAYYAALAEGEGTDP